MISSKNKVTAVLAVYNAENTIEKCLQTLLKQSVPAEIIVVDDGSTDNTKTSIIRIIELLNAKNVTLLEQKHRGPARARNWGAQHAKGSILILVDADMTFDTNYVRDLIGPIVNGQSIGTYTANEKVANWVNVWARCWNWQEGWAPEVRFPAHAPEEGTDFRAILKSEFDRVGGFDDIGYTDTWSLFHKLGVKPKKTMALCYHANPDTLGKVFRQARWSAKRPYKHGMLGTAYALVRTSLPISILAGVAKSLKYAEPSFCVFKIVYDWGRFLGIVEMVLTGKLSK